MHDARLLGGEEFVPEWIVSLQGLTHVSFLDIGYRLARRAPGAHDDLRRAKQTAELVDDRIFDLRRGHAPHRKFFGITFQNISRDVIAIELAALARVSRRHRS